MDSYDSYCKQIHYLEYVVTRKGDNVAKEQQAGTNCQAC